MGRLGIFFTFYVALSESLCLSRSDKTLGRTYEVSDNAVSNAISLIENERKVSSGFKQLHMYIKSKEAAGIRIKPEVYGRYAEAFWLLGKRGIPEDVQVDTSKVIEACEIFLNSTRGVDNTHYAMLALQIYSSVLHSLGFEEKGAQILNEMYKHYITGQGFTCPAHKYFDNDQQISKVVDAVVNSIPSAATVLRSRRVAFGDRTYYEDGGVVDVWYADDLSVSDFHQFYLQRRQPVKIMEVTRGWGALKSWSWWNLPQTFKDVPNFASWHNSSGCVQSFIMSDFFYHCPKHTYGDFKMPKYFTGLNDISYAFGLRLRASYTDFMVFSHRGGGAGFHKDAYDQSFWNICVHGYKKCKFVFAKSALNACFLPNMY